MEGKIYLRFLIFCFFIMISLIFGFAPKERNLNPNVTYTLHKVENPTSTQLDMYALIDEAMQKSCNYYNQYTKIVKHLNVYYNPEVPTADGNSNGNIRFGAKSSMNYITAMHEIAHTLGIGTKKSWSSLLYDGIYNGSNANEVYQSMITDSTLKLNGDNNHFWPFGLNYTTEVKSDEDLINHCRIVEAMLLDGL